MLKSSSKIKISMRVLFILILSICVFTSCKKRYEEDEKRTCKKPEKRLSGDWKIKYYEFNGNSMVDLLNSKIKTFNLLDLTYSVDCLRMFNRKQIQSAEFTPRSFIQQPYYYSPLTEDNSNVRFPISPDNFSGPSSHEDSAYRFIFITPLRIDKNVFATSWNIKHLFKNNLHLQLKTDSGNYDIYFEK